MPNAFPASTLLRRLVASGLPIALGTAAVMVPALVITGSVQTPAGAASAVATYDPGTPSLATITSPSGCAGVACAPWNEAQGDAGSTAYPSSDLLPTYTPGGPTTGSGSTAEPNVAVYPGATSGTATVSPYPSGTVGTPGPLDDYCGSGTHAAESKSTSTPTRQPSGTTLPFAPAYFPHVVKNADGTLTGYFDYRPKDADEALVAATATATGKSWTYQGEALEQNAGYCPSADTNDDGEGHANVITIGGNTYLYTLPRAAGDMQGVGMIVHRFAPSTTNPLTGLPTTEKTGIDPDAFVPTGAAAETVTHGVASTIPVTSTGTARSPEQLVAGGFVDLTATPTPTAAAVIACTGTTSTSLTGCSTASGDTATVRAGDLIEQVLGYASKAVTVPAGPNTTTGTGSADKTITVVTTSNGSTKGFTNALSGSTFNDNAPNRAYVNGVAIYCSQANTNPTTKIETCTTGPAGSALAVAAGAPITSDPIVPATADDVAAGDGTTTGLVAPDGIVGVLPNYPGAPAGSTIVMYTEKELSYYVAGEMPKTSGGTFGATFSVTFTPGPYEAEDMPSTISPSAPVTVQMGDTTKKTVIPVTCTGLTAGTTDTLTGCSVPSADVGDSEVKSTSFIGAPGAATVSYTTLNLTGEGKTTPEKLMKNNEDLTVLRVAYTTTGVDFQTAGLADTGIISGNNTGGSNYDDISNPTTTANPTNGQGTIDLNEYAKPGTADATEMRWVGSAGSIITNPDGTYGLFLSGAWAADGDSDAFNQIFYSQSSTGERWSVPKMVVSTDYTFSASEHQDATLKNGVDTPLTVSAYYEGRAYGPSVVQNADGSLTMVFAGYRLPKTLTTAGTTVGTGYNGAPQWTIGATDPALYRNILTVHLTPSLNTQTTVAATPANPVIGQPVTLSATVSVPSNTSATPTGDVTFTGTGGTLCTGTLNGTSPDTASCSYTYTSPGSDSVDATYAGDTNFATSTSPSPATVTIRDTTSTDLTASPSSAVVGQTVTLTAVVTATAPTTGAPTGSVTFADAGGTLCTGTLNAGNPDTASCSTRYTSPTTDTITATYGGDVGFGPSSSGSTTVSVAKAPTTTAVTSSGNPAVTGQSVTFTASVGAVPPGGGTATGSVTFALTDPAPTKGPGRLPVLSCQGGDIQSLSTGSATCSIPAGLAIAQSPVTVVATYSGSPSFGPSSSSPFQETVDKDASTVTVTSRTNPTATEAGARFTAVVAAAVPGAGSPTGRVTWAITGAAGRPVACEPLSQSIGARTGQATCVVDPGQLSAGDGPYTVTATYSGDTSFDGSTGTVTQDVSRAASRTTIAVTSPAASGRPAWITATVVGTPASAGTPTGSVTFSIVSASGTAIACSGGNTVSLRGGTATCQVPTALVVAGSPYTVSATYPGDANFLPSNSASKSIKVKK